MRKPFSFPDALPSAEDDDDDDDSSSEEKEADNSRPNRTCEKLESFNMVHIAENRRRAELLVHLLLQSLNLISQPVKLICHTDTAEKGKYVFML